MPHSARNNNIPPPFFAFRVFWVATAKTIANRLRNGGGVNPKGRMLLFWALGGLGDEGRHGRKMKKFRKKISKIFILNISASAPSI